MSYGYNFFFGDGGDVLTFPITPAELTIKVGSKNSVVTLINGEDINILKSPGLTEVEFEARFPMRKYPYSRNPEDFQTYFDKFKELKEKKKSFQFIVTRTTPNGKRLWDTNILVALEDFTIKESADEGDDVLIDFKLKQWKHYGVTTIKVQQKAPDTTSTSNTNRAETNTTTDVKTHPIKSGETLWSIAKYHYGNGSLYTKIFEANKTGLDNEAKKHGKQSSSNGHWIYPNYVLTIPPK
jgi:nucleoid-associated protein YgaU